MAALKAHNCSTEKARYLRVDTPETSFLELHWQSVQHNIFYWCSAFSVPFLGRLEKSKPLWLMWSLLLNHPVNCMEAEKDNFRAGDPQ